MDRLSNQQVEDAAIAWIMELERRAERQPTDTRRSGGPADIVSPPRTIEVKAYGGSARGEDLWLEVRQYEEARRNPDFWIYVVDNIRSGDPKQYRLIQLGGDRLARLLERAREQHYYTVPFPVALYDRAP